MMESTYAVEKNISDFLQSFCGLFFAMSDMQDSMLSWKWNRYRCLLDIPFSVITTSLTRPILST